MDRQFSKKIISIPIDTKLILGPPHLRLIEVMANKSVGIPFFSSQVSAGFPSPADDHLEQELNIHDLLVVRPSSTYFLRVQGHSMTGDSINDGDILVVDRSITPRHMDIVVACLDSEFSVKRYKIRDKELWLLPSNPNYQAIKVTEDMDCTFFGVVTSVVHQFKR